MYDAHYDAVVGRIYEAAMDPRKWEPALAAFAEFAGSDIASLSDFDYKRRILWRLFTHGITEEQNREYVERFMAIDPRVPLILAHQGERLWSDHDGLDDEVRRNHPLYKDYLNPKGQAEYLAAKLGDELSCCGALNFRRPGTQRVGPEEHQVFRSLVRHLLRIARRFTELDERLQLSEAALEALQDPVAVVRRDGQVHAANTAFDRLLSGTDAVSLHADGRLRCHDPAAHAALLAALDEVHRLAHQEPVREARSPWTFSLEGPGRRPLRATVAPIPPLYPVSPRTDAPSALLKLVDPSTPPSEAALMHGFKLTRAEARLARELWIGGSLKEVAQRLGITENTAKSQTSAVLGKTGTTRRSDMLTMLASLPR